MQLDKNCEVTQNIGYVASTEDDMASRLEGTCIKLSKHTNVAAEQSYFAPNPYEFIE